MDSYGRDSSDMGTTPGLGHTAKEKVSDCVLGQLSSLESPASLPGSPCSQPVLSLSGYAQPHGPTEAWSRLLALSCGFTGKHWSAPQAKEAAAVRSPASPSGRAGKEEVVSH